MDESCVSFSVNQRRNYAAFHCQNPDKPKTSYYRRNNNNKEQSMAIYLKSQWNLQSSIVPSCIHHVSSPVTTIDRQVLHTIPSKPQLTMEPVRGWRSTATQASCRDCWSSFTKKNNVQCEEMLVPPYSHSFFSWGVILQIFNVLQWF